MSGISEEALNDLEMSLIGGPLFYRDKVQRKLIAEIRRQRELIDGLQPLAKLGVEAIEASWDGCHFDGGDIQERAKAFGAIQESAEGYDPALHGESDICEPGDTWHEFPPAVLAAKRSLEGE